MPPPVAAQLAQALGLPPAQGEQALSEVVALLRQQLQATGEATVEELGTFRHDGRALSFEPTEALAEAVNHRFAGLPAVTRPPAPEPERPPEPAVEEVFEQGPLEEELGSEVQSHEEEIGHRVEAEEATASGTGEDANQFDAPGGGESHAEAPYEEATPEASTPPLARVPWEEPAIEPAEPPPSPADDEGLAGVFVPITPISWTPADDPPPDLPFSNGGQVTFLDSGEGTPAEPALPAGEGAPREDEEALPTPQPEPPVEEEPRWLTEHPPEPAPDAPPSQEDASLVSGGPEPDEPDPHERALDALLEGVWTPRAGPDDADHPLGPMPAELMEDADFDVIEGSAADPYAPPEPSPDPLLPEPSAGVEPLPPPPAAPPRPHEAASAPFLKTREPLSEARPHPEAEPLAPPRRRRRAWLPFAAGAAVLLLLALGLLLWPRSAPTLAVAERPAPAAPAPAPAPESPPADAPEGPSFADPEEAPPPPADTPLRSADGVTPARGGYTWIVASEAARPDADRIAARYRAEGYRASVLPADVRGRTAFRVGVGQFPTAADADRARGQLPPFAPADTWRLAL